MFKHPICIRIELVVLAAGFPRKELRHELAGGQRMIATQRQLEIGDHAFCPSSVERVLS